MSINSLDVEIHFARERGGGADVYAYRSVAITMFIHGLLDVLSRLLQEFLEIRMLYVDRHVDFTDCLLYTSDAADE